MAEKVVIKVVDSVPGSGKTEAAIAFMKANPSRRYLFITPYLEEIKRIQRSCPELYFAEPEPDADRWTRKLDSLRSLLLAGDNIASTHALFALYTDEIRELIASQGYTLILDEVMNVVERENVSIDDFRVLFQAGVIAMEEDGLHVRWLQDDYRGRFIELKSKAQMRNLFFFEDKLLFWSVPAHSFNIFKEVYVLTYLFEAQTQCYYYRMHGIEFSYMGVEHTDEGYRFSDRQYVPQYARQLIDKVHILTDEKANAFGEKRSALSSNWYKIDRKTTKGAKIKALAKMTYNVLHHRFNAVGGDCMWTTFKEQQKVFAVNGYKKCFLSYNARATNAYRDRHYLAYCVNVYFHPVLKRYFQSQGVDIHEDRYALSEMIQWIWRSAIRCGEEIWIYVPSSRMRGLLKGWLEELANAP